MNSGSAEALQVWGTLDGQAGPKLQFDDVKLNRYWKLEGFYWVYTEFHTPVNLIICTEFISTSSSYHKYNCISHRCYIFDKKIH